MAGVVLDEALHRRQRAQAARDEHRDREQHDGAAGDEGEALHGEAREERGAQG